MAQAWCLKLLSLQQGETCPTCSHPMNTLKDGLAHLRVGGTHAGGARRPGHRGGGLQPLPAVLVAGGGGLGGCEDDAM